MNTSLSIFEKEHASREKYIYFICGLAAAIVAYIGKDYIPKHPFDRTTQLTLSALGSLILCLSFGMASMIFYINALGINKEFSQTYERKKGFIDHYTEFLAGTKNLFLDYQTCKKLSGDEIKNIIDDLDLKAQGQKKEMDKKFQISNLWFWLSHGCLIIGFALLILAKLVR